MTFTDSRFSRRSAPPTRLVCFALLASGILGSECSRRPAGPPASPAVTSRPSSSTQSSAGSSQLQVGSEPLSGVDAQDAPDAPRALPRSGHVSGWIKTQPIQVHPVNQPQSIGVSGRLAEAWPYFRIERASTCRYRADTAEVQILFIETSPDHPLDAFGLFTLMAADPKPLLRPDGSARGTRIDAPHTRTAWQGHVYVEVTPQSDTSDAARARMDQLLDRIIFALPGAEPPLLTRIIPRDRRERCRVWHVRTTRALALLNLDELEGLDPERWDQSLGLNGGIYLSMASIDVASGEPHLLWLVTYPTPDAARAAQARMNGMKEAHPSALERATAVEPPVGRHLAGTWTRQQESLQPVMPLLLAALPESEPAMTRPASQPATHPQ